MDNSLSSDCLWDASNFNPFATSSCVSQSASSIGESESEKEKGRLGCGDAALPGFVSESILTNVVKVVKVSNGHL